MISFSENIPLTIHKHCKYDLWREEQKGMETRVISEPMSNLEWFSLNPQIRKGTVMLPEIPRSQTAKLIVIISAGLSFFFRLEDI